jgi:hypothetical protein
MVIGLVMIMLLLRLFLIVTTTTTTTTTIIIIITKRVARFLCFGCNGNIRQSARRQAIHPALHRLLPSQQQWGNRLVKADAGRWRPAMGQAVLIAVDAGAGCGLSRWRRADGGSCGPAGGAGDPGPSDRLPIRSAYVYAASIIKLGP